MSTQPTVRILLVVLLLAIATLTPGHLSQAAPQSNAGAEFAGDVVLVRFRDGATALQKAEARQLIEAETETTYSLVPGLEKLRLRNASISVPDAVQRLARLDYVQYAEPDYTVYAAVIPNDPRWGDLWGMTNIKAPQAWDTYTGDANFVVADIDTGVDRNHPDLAANMWTNPGEIAGNGIDDDANGYIDDVYGWDWAYNDNNPSDVNGHGSHTSGTVGAVGNNGVGVVGVNWNVKIMALKFLNDSGSGSTSNAISALNYAVNKGVKVSNNSWGGGGYSQALYDAIENAKSVGHLFIAAAGNNGTNNDTSPFYPASYNNNNLISVAAIDINDAKASFSNYGATTVDLGAPGVNIVSTTPNSSYSSYNGTSMATPHVAGAAALLYALNPTWTYGQVRDRILSTARPIAALSGKTVTGGTLDLAAAVSGATPPPPTATPTPAPTATPAPSSAMHVGDLDGSGTSVSTKYWRASVTITVHDSSENPVASATVSGSWSGGTGGSASCTTNSSGQCTVQKNLSKSRVSSATFTVNNVTRSGYTYNAGANHDPDGDSNGTSITVNRP